MNWLKSREEKTEEAKKKEEIERKKAQDLQSLKDSLLKRLKEVTLSINSTDLQSSKRGFPDLFDDRTDPRDIIKKWTVDENELSPIFNKSISSEVGGLDFDIVECFYLFFSLFDYKRRRLNKYNKTVLFIREYSSKIILNSSFLSKIYEAGFRQGPPTYNATFGQQIPGDWYVDSDDIDKVSRCLEQLEDHKLVKFCNLARKRRVSIKDGLDLSSIENDENIDYLQDIKKNILDQKKIYNKRIINLFNSKNLEELKKALFPNILNSYGILTEPYKRVPGSSFGRQESGLLSPRSLDNWEEIGSSKICSLIVIDSISKIESYDSPHDDIEDKSFSVKTKTSSLNARGVPISYDHIYIDGVGWMHEDEVGRDR